MMLSCGLAGACRFNQVKRFFLELGTVCCVLDPGPVTSNIDGNCKINTRSENMCLGVRFQTWL